VLKTDFCIVLYCIIVMNRMIAESVTNYVCGYVIFCLNYTQTEAYVFVKIQ